jgi:ATP-binding cassette subfamily B multidrug efflux pump
MAFHGPGGGFRRMAGLREEKAHDTGQVLRRLLGYFGASWPWLVVVLVLVVLSTLMRLAGPYLLGVAVDQFITPGDKAGLTRTMLLLLATYLLNWGATASQFYLMTLVGQRVLYALRTQIFQRIQALSLTFFDQREAGDLMSRLVNDVEVINHALNVGLVRLSGDVLTLIGIVIAMTSLNARLALSSFIVLPFMLLTTTVFSRRAFRAFRRTRETIGQVSAELEEKISGVREVQAFSREGASQARFAELSAANRDANVQAVGITSAFTPALDVLSTVAMAIVVGYGGYLALNELVTVGTIVAFLDYVRRFYMPIRSLAQLYTQLQAALAGAERIFELIDTEPDIVDAPDAMEMPPIQGRVEFEHVSFAYKDGEPVLEDVSLVAEPGQTVALVGETGAGKTTLANLIGRFYEVDSGAVRIDGRDVRSVTRASLRQQMGIVLQDTFLFADTVMENIRYGRLEAGDEEVIAAARLVNAHDFISRLPEGYQTELTERGSNLSQGQRQLISFARAVLADPRILILDEATSSVDTRTELLIQRALAELLKGRTSPSATLRAGLRTSFVIAHRLSTIRNADQVWVIQDGRMVERGTHDSLMAQQGIYYDLYMSQFRRESDVDERGHELAPGQLAVDAPPA